MLPHAGIAGVAVYPLVIVPYQTVGHGHVSNIGRGGNEAVCQTGNGINADMRLHAEMPLITFPGLLKIRWVRSCFSSM